MLDFIAWYRLILEVSVSEKEKKNKVIFSSWVSRDDKQLVNLNILLEFPEIL